MHKIRKIIKNEEKHVFDVIKRKQHIYQEITQSSHIEDKKLHQLMS